MPAWVQHREYAIMLTSNESEPLDRTHWSMPATHRGFFTWSEINMADELLFTKANKIATITLNRPEQLNTFHDGMLADWAAALRECQADDAINVVVLTAAGRVFCAGGDLGTMGRRDGNPAWDMGQYIRQNVHPVARAVDALHKPYLTPVSVMF
jgi:enoyl-CoA hydratase/carnithine racemase